MSLSRSHLSDARLGIVVAWRNRPELGQALPTISECAERYGGDVTIVNYGGDVGQLSRLLDQVQSGIRVISVRDTQWFNKARAQNIGAAHSYHDLLFFCDCDILIKTGSLDDLVEDVRSDKGKFGTVAGLKETECNARNASNVVAFGYCLKLRLANGRALEIVDSEEDAETGARHAPGLLVTHRGSFERLGGYNGRLQGWGWEDQDMIARLTLGEGLERIQSGHVMHISHNDDTRVRHYPPASDRWEMRDRMFRQALNYYDRGDLSGTYHEDANEPVLVINPPVDLGY